MNETTKHPGVIETVKDKGVAAIQGAGNIVESTVNTTAHVVTTTVKDAKKVGVGAGKAVAAVAGEAIKAVGEVASTTVSTVHNVVTKPAPVGPPPTARVK
ncbi:MAG TPA: hypothetical protein VN625_08645 [Desulfuromonadaceae bacterium]|nr:hypothetical protein [Desulfuromonadaceae bacterium]